MDFRKTRNFRAFTGFPVIFREKQTKSILRLRENDNLYRFLKNTVFSGNIRNENPRFRAGLQAVTDMSV